jgi:hypothetical protein
MRFIAVPFASRLQLCVIGYCTPIFARAFRTRRMIDADIAPTKVT